MKSTTKNARAEVGSPAEKLYAAAIRSHLNDPGVSTGKLFGAPGLKVGGKLFAMLVKGQLVVKLPKARVDALVAAGQGAHFDPGHGRLMKEWVAVAPGSQSRWSRLVKEARTFVQG